jgi:hypothetical protein
MKSFLEFKTVSVSISGDYHQIMFDDGLDTEGEPYFLIQGESGFEDDGLRYFESHIESLIGYYIPKSASLSTGCSTTSSLHISYGEKQHQDVEIRFGLHKTDFHELASALMEIIPKTRIER